jgi:hypothetical protein
VHGAVKNERGLSVVLGECATKELVEKNCQWSGNPMPICMVAPGLSGIFLSFLDLGHEYYVKYLWPKWFRQNPEQAPLYFNFLYFNSSSTIVKARESLKKLRWCHHCSVVFDHSIIRDLNRQRTIYSYSLLNQCLPLQFLNWIHI